MRMIVLSPDKVFRVDRARFEAAVRSRFGDGVIESERPEMDVTVRFERDGEPMFHVSTRGRAGACPPTEHRNR